MYAKNYVSRKRHITFEKLRLESRHKRDLDISATKCVIAVNGCCACNFSSQCVGKFIASRIFKTAQIKFKRKLRI